MRLPSVSCVYSGSAQRSTLDVMCLVVGWGADVEDEVCGNWESGDGRDGSRRLDLVGSMEGELHELATHTHKA
jgi:hypothetical protein